MTRIETTPDIQATRARLLVQLTAARQAEQSARAACGVGDAKGVRKSLVKSAKRLKKFVKRLRTRAAKQTLPQALRTELEEAGDALRSDVQTLRQTVQCPADAVAS
jgi:hypothetical protein